MTEQKVALEIRDRSLTKLAGNSYGRKLFSEQVDGKIDLDQPFTIEFPEQIDYLASSFIQGFLEKFILKSGEREWKKISTSSLQKSTIPKKLSSID